MFKLRHDLGDERLEQREVWSHSVTELRICVEQGV
jgi:hypothetical protein